MRCFYVSAGPFCGVKFDNAMDDHVMSCGYTRWVGLWYDPQAIGCDLEIRQYPYSLSLEPIKARKFILSPRCDLVKCMFSIADRFTETTKLEVFDYGPFVDMLIEQYGDSDDEFVRDIIHSLLG